MAHEQPSRQLTLFDLDFTLVNVGQQHHEGHRLALRTVYGIDAEPDVQQHQGHTQPNIIRMICRHHGLSHGVIEAGLTKALRMLSEVTISLLDHDLRSCVLPGVRELLDALESHGHSLGLVTGRAEAAGRIIVERSALDSYFPIAAFGDEEGTREDLLRLAIGRAVQLQRFEPGQDGLAVVGDAPPDLQAAHALGARAIGVATGYHSAGQLAEHGPAVVLPDLTDWRAALGAISVADQEDTG